jgi:XTP/dITP diphosphohydrolase
VDALGGAPGVRTRRFAGDSATDAENNSKLLATLDGLPPEQRGARYVCVLALALPKAGSGRRGFVEVLTRRGTSRGRIALRPAGAGGFGYDPIFEPAPEPPGGRTFGQYSPAEKHRISHRARAARAMAPVLDARLRAGDP